MSSEERLNLEENNLKEEMKAVLATWEKQYI